MPDSFLGQRPDGLLKSLVVYQRAAIVPFRHTHTETDKDLKEQFLARSLVRGRTESPTNQIKLGICFFFFRSNGKRHLEEEDGRHSRDSGLQTLWVIEPRHDSSFFFIIIYHSWELKGSFGVVCQPNELCQFSRFLSWCKVGTKDRKAWTTSPDKIRVSRGSNHK